MFINSSYDIVDFWIFLHPKFQAPQNTRRSHIVNWITKLVTPGKGTNLKLFLWVWSFCAYLVMLAYESLALDMTILPVLEETYDTYEDFAKNNITMITRIDDVAPYHHMRSTLDKYERKVGYEALTIDTEFSRMTWNDHHQLLIELIHKRGTHAFTFIGK